jgi:dihydropteroate synthase
VVAELGERVAALVDAGVTPDRLVLDPGLGFAKRAEHNWQLLAGLEDLEGLGFPLLIGASRKSFLGDLLADDTGVARPTDQREPAHAVLIGWLAHRKVWGVRVHDVRSTRDAIAVARRLEGPT